MPHEPIHEVIYRTAFEAMGEAIVLQDAEGRIMQCNPSAERILGLNGEQLRGLTSLDPRWRALHPDGSDFRGEEHPAVITRTTGQPVSGCLMGVHRPDGEVRWVEVNSRLVEATPATPTTVVVTFMDVTDRMKSEELIEARFQELLRRHQLILNHAGEGICGTDPRGHCTFANPMAATIVGRAEGWIDEPLHDILHGDSCDTVHCLLQRALSRAAPCDLFLTAIVTRSGKRVAVEAVANPITDGDTWIGTVLTFRDVEERVAVERMKDELLSVVSHELRTPLTSIRGALGLLQSGKLGTFEPKASRMLDISVANSDRLIRLINDFLDLERFTSNTFTMQRIQCDIDTLLKNAMETVRALAHGAEIRLEVEPVQSCQVNGDPDRLVQTLSNLLGNAIKFSTPGQTVMLGAMASETDIHVTIKDQGRGIPEDHLTSIFGRFQQVDASDSRQKGGTGLGLAICKKIVEQHGGRIWADSVLGQGSTFHVVLPRAGATVETA